MADEKPKAKRGRPKKNKDGEKTPVKAIKNDKVKEIGVIENNPVKDVKTTNKGNYYDISNIVKENADFNLIIGERGNGKTYQIQKLALNEYLTNGGQFFLLRRWVDDVKPSNAQNFIDGNLLNSLSELTNGRFTNVKYDVGKYVLACNDEKTNKLKWDVNNTIGYVWSITEAERLKGQSFPKVKHIILEEFISLSTLGYEPDEINKFTNIISTIVRDRTDVKIWLLGNTVNPVNPYFEYFGIKGLQLKQGEIITKIDTNTGCKLALEYCEKRRKGSLYGTSAKYFCFGNNAMIVGGKWQLAPLPLMSKTDFKKLCPKILMKYLINFDEKRILLSLCLDKNRNKFLHVKNYNIRKSTDNFNVILDLKPNLDKRYFKTLKNIPDDKFYKLDLIDCILNGKIWYSENVIGHYFLNYLKQSQYDSFMPK